MYGMKAYISHKSLTQSRYTYVRSYTCIGKTIEPQDKQLWVVATYNDSFMHACMYLQMLIQH